MISKKLSLVFEIVPYFYWNLIFRYSHPYFCLWWKSFKIKIFHSRSWLVLTYERSQIDANLLNMSELWMWYDTSMSRFLRTFITTGTILINLVKLVKFAKFVKFALQNFWKFFCSDECIEIFYFHQKLWHS